MMTTQTRLLGCVEIKHYSECKFCKSNQNTDLIVPDLGTIGLTLGTVPSQPGAMCNTEQRRWRPQPHKPLSDEFLPADRPPNHP